VQTDRPRSPGDRAARGKPRPGTPAALDRLPHVPRPVLLRVLHNLPQKLGALVAAVVLWLAATSDRQTTVERSFEVRLVAVGEAASRRALDLPPTVRVTLAGARDRLEEVGDRLIEATVDVRGLEDGPFTAEVRVNPPANTRVARTDPREVSGVLDAVIARELEVRVVTIDAPGDRLVRLLASPRVATATGPATRLAGVAYALALAPPELAAGGEPVLARLTPVGLDGRPVDGVSLKPEEVRVSRTDTSVLAEKVVPVDLADLGGGYSLRGAVLRPVRVRVAGPPEAVSQLDRLTARLVGPIVPGPLVAQTQLVLPSGVSALDPAPTVSGIIVAP